MNLKNLVLYGAGNRGKMLIQLMDLCNLPITAVVDSNTSLWGQKIGNHIIESPDILRGREKTDICITAVSSLAIGEIKKRLKGEYKIEFNDVSYLELIMALYEKIDIDSLRHSQHLSANPINAGKVSVIFDCAYGLVLGGVEEWTKGICSEFLRQGEYTPYILTNYGDYSIPDELTNNILRVDVDKDTPFSIHNISQIMNCIEAYLPCILVTSKPEDALLAGKLLRKKYGDAIKVISGIRGGSDEIYQNYIDMRSCTDLYTCVSSDIRKNMILRGTDPGKIFTMICPITCPDELLRDYAEDSDRPIRLGYAGRLTVEQKRMDLMIRLISDLEDRNVNYDLEFAGEGDYAPVLQDFIIQNNCQNKIRLIGKIENNRIPQFWQTKDICINLADYEGRSRSIAESMANGAIPVVTATSGVNDDIVDGENGYIVEIGDYKAVADHVSHLDRNRDKLPQMGKAAYSELKAKSSMEDHYRFWQNMIAIVTGGAANAD